MRSRRAFVYRVAPHGSFELLNLSPPSLDLEAKVI